MVGLLPVASFRISRRCSQKEDTNSAKDTKFPEEKFWTVLLLLFGMYYYSFSQCLMCKMFVISWIASGRVIAKETRGGGVSRIQTLGIGLRYIFFLFSGISRSGN